jgi:hypothetical protein
MNSSIITVIKKLEDSEYAKVRLGFENSETAYFDCIYKESEAPSFFLVFPPGTIPDDIIIKDQCSVLIHKRQDEKPIVVSAKIEARRGERTLELTASEIIDPVSLREYFRVFYRTPITASYRPPGDDLTIELWDMQGTIVDLSASGVLAIFPDEFEHNENVSLQFQLIGEERTIKCIAHSVRTRYIRKSRVQIALSFDKISSADQDAIVTECMREQRKQLRTRTQED